MVCARSRLVVFNRNKMSGRCLGPLMPYPTNTSLPAAVRHHLPPRAQDLYREAFNDAWVSYARDQRREEIAHRTAWAAVKRPFHKGAGGQWMPNALEGASAC